MAVEILTVSLSDESIEKIALRVSSMLNADRPVTQSNPPSPQNPQSAERSGFQQEAGGWGNPAPQQTQQAPPPQAPPQQGQDGLPTCQCGQPMRWVAPGFSQNSGKAYNGFYACPKPRGQQCPRQ
jgi:hypothetical protein